MSWHYRARKTFDPMDETPEWTVVEYYPKDKVWTERPIWPESDTYQGLIEQLEHMLRDIKKHRPIVDRKDQSK